MARNKKVIIVTGASRGIGRGIALVLARDEGHTVYATARSEDSLQELAALVSSTVVEGSAGVQGVIIPCAVDHSDDQSCAALIERVAREQHGRLDGLVNNAYGGVNSIAEHFGKFFWEKPLSVWNASHTVGLRSHYVASALAVPQMLQQPTAQKGIIVNVSSSGGAGYLFDIAYGVGKQGLDRMGADMATELIGTGITVLTLWPGAVKTETTSFPGGETVEFSGRAIAALFRDASASQLLSYNGKVVMSTELAVTFGFTDVDGKVPGAKRQQQHRAKMESTVPVQWSLAAPLPPPTDPRMGEFFAKARGAAKSSKSKL